MYHQPNINCPTSQDERLRRKRTCPQDELLAPKIQSDVLTYRTQSCTPRILNLARSQFHKDWRLWADSGVLKDYANIKL